MEKGRSGENYRIWRTALTVSLGVCVAGNAAIWGGLYAWSELKSNPGDPAVSAEILPQPPAFPQPAECPAVDEAVKTRITNSLHTTRALPQQEHSHMASSDQESMRAAQLGLHVLGSKVTEKAWSYIYESPSINEAARRLNNYSQKNYGITVTLANKATAARYKPGFKVRAVKAGKSPTGDRWQRGNIASMVDALRVFPTEQIAASGLREITISGPITRHDGFGASAIAAGDRIVMSLGSRALPHEMGHVLDYKYCQGLPDKTYEKLNPKDFRYNPAIGENSKAKVAPKTWKAVSEHYSITSATENKANNFAEIMSGKITCGPQPEIAKRMLLTARLEAMHPNVGLYWTGMNNNECAK